MPVFYKTKKVETTFYKYLDSFMGDHWRQLELFPKFTASIDVLHDGKYLVRFLHCDSQNGEPSICSDYASAQECASVYLAKNIPAEDSQYFYRQQI